MHRLVKRKLAVGREVIRALATHDLSRVAGGGRYFSVDAACGTEQTLYRWCASDGQWCSTTV